MAITPQQIEDAIGILGEQLDVLQDIIEEVGRELGENDMRLLHICVTLNNKAYGRLKGYGR